jgi:uncharacterized membrane protein YhhN
MTDDKDWFAPKRYGYGAGVPISWQGWAVTLGFAATVCGAAFLFRDRPLPMFAAIVPFLIAFIVITARTTRGGWRWRWGKED